MKRSFAIAILGLAVLAAGARATLPIMPRRVPPAVAAVAAKLPANPRRAAAREWRGMSWAEKEARAMNIAKQTWNATDQLYGRQGQAMPATQFGNAGPMSGVTEYGGAGPSKVTMSKGIVAWLAKPKVLIPKGRADARKTLMHEWAHTFQSPTLEADPNTNHKEEAAELFATYWAHKKFGATAMPRATGPLPYSNRKAGSQDLAAAYGPGYWRQRQFGP